MTRQELKEKFRDETGLIEDDHGYMGEYIAWLESQLITKEFEVGDIVEITDRIHGHKFEIGQQVQLTTWDIFTEPKWLARDQDEEYFVDETEFKHIN